MGIFMGGCLLLFALFAFIKGMVGLFSAQIGKGISWIFGCLFSVFAGVGVMMLDPMTYVILGIGAAAAAGSGS